MKTAIPRKDIEQYHSKCVCQTCTCHKHRCPECQVHVPFLEHTSYQNDYIEHPISTWNKPPPEKAKPYQPYGNLSSSYQTHYPGYKPQMREKIVPRVKDQDKNIPFQGESEYKNKYPGKSVPREPIKNKDKIYAPMNQPFLGQSTYKSSYPKKSTNPHQKRKPVQYQFPAEYKFDGETTYKNSFNDKPLIPAKSCKSDQKLGVTGPHDLNTIYRKDYAEKKMPEPCPILKMPPRPSKVSEPNYHLVYSKFSNTWQEK